MAVPNRTSPSGPLIESLNPDFNPMPRVAYVDRLTEVPSDEQNGSALLPFSSIALAAAALALTGGTILIAPGDYSSEGSLTLATSNWTLQCADVHPNTVFGLPGANTVTIVGLNTSGNVNLVGIATTGTVTTSALTLDSCYIADDLTTLFVDAFDTRFLNTCTINVGLGMGLVNCRLDAAVINITTNGTSRFVDCELVGSFTFTSTVATATLLVDGRTNFFLQSITTTLTNAALTVQSTPGANVRQPSSIAASGALGVIDLTLIESGGVVVLAPSANWNIDGFTVKPNGFWFDLFVDSTNTAFVGTLNQETGTTAGQRIRNPNNLPYQCVAGQMTRMRYQLGRWRIGNPPTPAQLAIISVPVPALAAGVLGYVDVSLVGTVLAGTPSGAQLLATPQADLAAAGDSS